MSYTDDELLKKVAAAKYIAGKAVGAESKPIKERYERIQGGLANPDLAPGEMITDGTYGTNMSKQAMSAIISGVDEGKNGDVITEGSLNDEQLDLLRRAIAMDMSQKGGRSGVVDGDNIIPAMLGYSRIDDAGRANTVKGVFGAANNNIESFIPNTLGSFGYEIDEDGNAWVNDVFDFSKTKDGSNHTMARKMLGNSLQEKNSGENYNAPRSVFNLGNIYDLLGEMSDKTDWTGTIKQGDYSRLKKGEAPAYLQEEDTDWF